MARPGCTVASRFRNDGGAFPGQNDARLAPLFAAREAGREREIERLLVEVARPVTATILGHYRRAWTSLRHQDLDDIAATVDFRLFEKLRALTAAPEETVQDLERYVAVLTYNAINDHMRRVFPERARLKNRLRYLLLNDARFALWSAAGTLHAGLAAWDGQVSAPAWIELGEGDVTRTMRDRNRPAAALVEIFMRIGRPVALDRLVDLMARLWQVVDLAPLAPPEPADESWTRMDRRETLVALWKEILELRPMQRKALLLNLRGPETPKGVLLLVLSGIATFDALAAALEMTPEELAALWSNLPLDDQRIAAILGVTRQQVVNLRKSARERLARRVKR